MILKYLKIGMVVGIFIAIGLAGLAVTTAIVDEQMLPQSQTQLCAQEFQSLKQMALMCLDNPIEQFLVQKVSLRSVHPSIKPPRHGLAYDATFVAYSLFAIPYTTIKVVPGSCFKQ